VLVILQVAVPVPLLEHVVVGKEVLDAQLLQDGSEQLLGVGLVDVIRERLDYLGCLEVEEGYFVEAGGEAHANLVVQGGERGDLRFETIDLQLIPVVDNVAPPIVLYEVPLLRADHKLAKIKSCLS